MNEETVVRVKHGKENPYFQFSRETAQRKEVSYEGRGMLAYLLSKPNDWDLRISDLIIDGCGRDKVYRIIGELVEKCYIIRTVLKDDETKRYTQTVYTIYEEPFFPLPEKPDTAFPDTANPLLHITDRKEERKEIAPTEVEALPPIKKRPVIAVEGVKAEVGSSMPNKHRKEQHILCVTLAGIFLGAKLGKQWVNDLQEEMNLYDADEFFRRWFLEQFIPRQTYEKNGKISHPSMETIVANLKAKVGFEKYKQVNTIVSPEFSGNDLTGMFGFATTFEELMGDS